MADNQSITTIMSEWLGIISSILIIIASVYAGIKIILNFFNKKELRISYISHRYNPLNIESNICHYTPFDNKPKYFYLSIDVEISNPTSENVFLNDIKLYFNKNKKHILYNLSAIESSSNHIIKNIEIKSNTNNLKYNFEFISDDFITYKYLSKNNKFYLSFKDIDNIKHFLGIKPTYKKIKILNGNEIKNEFQIFIHNIS